MALAYNITIDNKAAMSALDELTRKAHEAIAAAAGVLSAQAAIPRPEPVPAEHVAVAPLETPRAAIGKSTPAIGNVATADVPPVTLPTGATQELPKP